MKKQTAVQWLVSILNKQGFAPVLTDEEIQQAKEMEEQQSQLYATFCLRCINENLPVIRFEDWIKLEGDNK